MTKENWPALPLEAWEPTRATLHMWTQVVGKVRLEFSPYMNHWWQVPLYVTARGLTTSPIPYEGETFEFVFDFIAHNLLIEKNDGTVKTLRLAPISVAEFYADVMTALRSMGIAVNIWTMPVKIPHPIPFDTDRTHASYDRDSAKRLWRTLSPVDAISNAYGGRFTGKASPAHVFGPTCDRGVTRPTGRRARASPGTESMTRAA